MAIIIETCPKCGHDLQDVVLCTYPPIPRKECHNCGWSWEGQREEIIRVPFNEFINMGYSDKDSLNLANLAVDTAIAYNGCIDITDATNTLINMFNKDND